MSPSSSSVFDLFLGFLTGVILFLLVSFGVIDTYLLPLGTIGNILTIVIGILAFLALLIFGLYLFKRLWRGILGRSGRL
jgi:hypothetical protein